MKKHTFEYIIKGSAKILFNKLTTYAGLQQWFADKVFEKNNIYTFVWLNETLTAKIEIWNSNLVRFFWQNDNDNPYIEFKIVTNELTNDLTLIISDFSNKDSEFNKDFWDVVITELKYAVGDYNNF